MSKKKVCLSLTDGIEKFKNGNVKAAIELLEEATRLQPKSYEAFLYLGVAYAHIGKFNSSIGALRMACQINPKSVRIHYNLGQAYEAANVPQEAWIEYNKALEIDPTYTLAKTALASLKHRLPKLISPKLEIAA